MALQRDIRVFVIHSWTAGLEYSTGVLEDRSSFPNHEEHEEREGSSEGFHVHHLRALRALRGSKSWFWSARQVLDRRSGPPLLVRAPARARAAVRVAPQPRLVDQILGPVERLVQPLLAQLAQLGQDVVGGLAVGLGVLRQALAA